MSVSRRADGRWIVKFRSEGKWQQRSFRDEQTARAFDAIYNPLFSHSYYVFYI